MEKHYSVMLKEVITALKINPDGIYVDLTLGRAGHAKAILNQLTSGLLVGFDKDKQAIQESLAILKKTNKNFKLIHGDYRNLKHQLEQLKIFQVDGIIADLGVSSPQLDEAERGFSYNKDARLDMRMNQEQKLDAYEIVNNWSEAELISIFRNFADVKLPQRVAKGIIANRPIKTTLELVTIIRNSLPAAIVRQKNPAKAVFQALRIAVNKELEAITKMLDDAIDLLKINGLLAVITFHSLEDRIVKKAFGHLIKDDTGKLPIIIEPKFKAKTLKPSAHEININRRSRSAKLRVLTKLKD